MRSGRFYTLLVMRRGRQSKTPEVSRGKEKEWIVLENHYTYALYYCLVLSESFRYWVYLYYHSKRPYCEDVGIRSRHIILESACSEIILHYVVEISAYAFMFLNYIFFWLCL